MDERDINELAEAPAQASDPLEDAILQRSGMELGELVQRICSETGQKENEVVEAVYRIIGERRGKLMDPSPPSKYITYLFSHYSVWFWLVIGVIAALFSSIYLLPQSYPFTYIRYITGTLFIFFIPGYTLVEAFFHKHEIGRYELIALSMGLSLSITPLLILAMNYTPLGLDLTYTLTTLCLLTIPIGLIAVRRKYLNSRDGVRAVGSEETTTKELEP